jgi:uncharacterized protein YndB with AHSA1/START domain
MTINGLFLRMTRTLPAPRSAVWEAMTDPDQLAKWWGPKDFSSPSIDFDPRVGGRYRIAMQPPDGEPFFLHGEFREVEPPTRLTYSFVWEPPDPDDRETVVTVVLQDRDGRAEVSLDQGEFATEERRALHEGGWSDSFDKLAALLS